MNTNLFSNEEFQFIMDLVTRSGDLALSIQDGEMDVRFKKDESIVTKADLAVQELLISELRGKFPESVFVHEENFNRDKVEIDDHSLSFIIDPVDGTAMYSMRLPTWSISLGVFRGYEPVYGFVNSPGSNMFFHNDDTHAYLNGTPVQADKNLPVNRETNVFYASEIYKNFLIDYPGKVRNLGSTALQGSLLADSRRNRTLAFIGSAFLWDWAGAIPIILKAGSNLRYITGEDVDFSEIIKNSYEFPEFCIAYSIDDFESVRKIFKKNDK